MSPEHLEFAKELDRSSGIAPLPPDWCYYPAVESMKSDDVVAVEFWPGFSRDLTSWKLWINGSGLLSTVVSVRDSYTQGPARYEFGQVRIGPREARRVIELAERVGFGEFAERYDCDMTDMPLRRLAVRLAGGLKYAEFYGNYPRGFWPLWRRIHRYAPRVNRYIAWWARGFWGRLFDWGRCQHA
jgi:hypothetical protein